MNIFHKHLVMRIIEKIGLRMPSAQVDATEDTID